MPNYDYAREFGDTIHSNPDTYNVGHEGEPIEMADRIETALPGKTFRVRCENTNLTVVFDEALTAEEETTLDTAVTTQKAVDDWPPA